MTEGTPSASVFEQAVLQHLNDNGSRFELDPSALTVRYLLNLGGFGNHSFRVSDGERTFHAKLTDDEELIDCLDRWRQLHRLLEERYHAPRMIGMGGSVCVYGTLNEPVLRLESGTGPYNFDLRLHQWPTRALEAAAQERLIEWIERGELSYRELIAAEYPIRDIGRALAEIGSSKPIKTLFRF